MSSGHTFRQVRAFFGRSVWEIGTGDGVTKPVTPSFAPMLGVLLFGLSSSVFAQSDEPAAIKIGESDFIPTARFEYLQTDNAFLRSSDQTEATAFIIKPRASWTADRRLLSLTGIYEGEYASYSKEALNYADHSLRAIVNAELSSRQRVRSRLTFNFDHQPLGTGLTRGFATDDSTQVEFLHSTLESSYTYGAQKARGNLTLGLNLTSHAYQNRDDITTGLDYLIVGPYARFSLRVSEDTRAFTVLRFDSVTFDRNTRDRNDISLLTGMQFDASGKSGGEFQLGASLSTPESGNDLTSFVASAELFFEPSVFSRFELTATRALDNDASSPLDEVLATRDTAELNWRHEWSSRFYHVADLSYQVINGECPNRLSVDRGSAGIEFNLIVRRWLHFGASVTGSSRETTVCPGVDSNEGDLSYESQVFGAHIRATL